jgi:pimeloyl-ACP methyl ester carboxylesterase
VHSHHVDQQAGRYDKQGTKLALMCEGRHFLLESVFAECLQKLLRVDHPGLTSMPRVPACVAVVVSALLCACVGSMSAPAPMHSIDYTNSPSRSKCLFVLLPGRGDRADTFEQRGFVEALRRPSLSIDVVAADATFGYYMRGTFLERLSADVLVPAKTRGYQEVWLAGPSMGGFGALFYSRSHPSDISGVLAIAPFLGEKELIAEIAAAGGLKHWVAPLAVERVDRDSYQRELWRWLQAATDGREAAPLLFMGYGASDWLREADALLAAELPPSRVFMTHGGHEWPTWRRVLEQFLSSPDFAAHCRKSSR